MSTLQLGASRVDKVVEAAGPSFYAGFLLPDSTGEAFAAEADWLEPAHYDPAIKRLIMSLHTYVIRTTHHTILVDTCVGNHKERPSTKPWHRMNGPWLDNLAALGVAPEAVDYVLCTHLHVDHVGWNTRLQDGRWVPTFPNAKYLFSKDEFDHWSRESESAAGRGGQDGCFEDSVPPVVDAGQADLVAGDHEIDDTLRLEPSPGHSPGHVCLNLQGDGRRAVFTGDMMHHPVQCAYPEWNSRFCSDPVLSRRTRTGFVERHMDTDTIVLAAHFAGTTAGRLVSQGGRKRFRFLDD